MFNSKKKHFKKKLSDIQRTIWDMEFKRFKSLEIREEVRGEYDNTKSKLAAVEAQLQDDKLSEEDKARLEDQQTLFKRDIERYESQMKQIDLDVDGAKPSEEYPDGVIGINHQLDSLHELKVLTKEYINEI